MIGADAIRGHIDLILLSILESRPSYAYELSKTITDRSRGEYVIKQTTLYTAVKRMQAQGLLDSYEDVSTSGKPRTYYKLTALGLAQLDVKRAEWRSTRALVDHFTEGTGSSRPPSTPTAPPPSPPTPTPRLRSRPGPGRARRCGTRRTGS